MENVPAVINNSNVLAELGIKNIGFTPEQAAESTGVKANRYFPFIQLLQRTSKGVEDFKSGSFIMKTGGKDKNPVDLGNSFDAFIVAVRGKATYYDGKTVKAEYHTVAQKTDGYDAMREKAKKDTNQEYKIGLDVLMYIPSVQGFAIYFANSATAITQIETEFCPLQGLAARVFSEFKEGSKGSWYLPKATEITNPTSDFSPDENLYKDAVKSFIFPTQSVEQQIEGAEKVDSTSTR